MKVVYKMIEDCKDCLYSDGRVCYELKKYLHDVCFELDCPLPSLSDVEEFTRYVTKEKELDCHGNCRNWNRWGYNKHLNADVGVCMASTELVFCHANGKACEEFDEL